MYCKYVRHPSLPYDCGGRAGQRGRTNPNQPGEGYLIGEFSLKTTSLTFTPGPGGSTLVQVNWEGPAAGLGTVAGTATFVSAGMKSGTWRLVWGRVFGQWEQPYE